jgi:hypothetical protein
MAQSPNRSDSDGTYETKDKNGIRAADLDLDDVIRNILRAWGVQAGETLVKRNANGEEVIPLGKWLEHS